MYDLFISQRNAYNLFDKVMCKFTPAFLCESYECEFTICYNQQVARPPLLKLRGACALLAPVVPTPLDKNPTTTCLRQLYVASYIGSMNLKSCKVVNLELTFPKL